MKNSQPVSETQTSSAPTPATNIPVDTNTSPQQPVMQDVPKPKGNIMPIVIIVLVLLLLISLSYIAYDKFLPSKVATPANPTTTPFADGTANNVVGTPSTKPTTDPTASWKVYNHKLYTIKYPLTFQIATGQFSNTDSSLVRIYSNGKEPLNSPHLTIIIDSDKNELSLNTLANDNYQLNINHKGIPAQSISKPTVGTFNGFESIEYSLKNKGFVSPREEYIGYLGIYNAIWVHAVNNN